MTSGQTVIGITDIPFMYSFVSIMYILLAGSIEDFSKYYMVGLIAGTLGTFFVFWHPIQWLIDKNLLSAKKYQSTYRIAKVNYDPPSYKVKIWDWSKLSLKTPAIKYLKDKVVGQIYFFIILITILVFVQSGKFLEIVGIEEFPYRMLISLGLIAMISGMAYFMIKQYMDFIVSFKIQCLYFLANQNNFVGDLSLLKSVIDLGDWDSAKIIGNKILEQNWNILIRFSEVDK